MKGSSLESHRLQTHSENRGVWYNTDENDINMASSRCVFALPIS